jgi:hypothetical protein
MLGDRDPGRSESGWGVMTRGLESYWLTPSRRHQHPALVIAVAATLNETGLLQWLPGPLPWGQREARIRVPGPRLSVLVSPR